MSTTKTAATLRSKKVHLRRSQQRKKTTMAKDIFERLQEGRPTQIEGAAKPQLGKIAARKARIKTLLLDVLANGPAPTNVVYQRGRAHGFSRKQLWSTRERMGIVTFKERKRYGRWFLALAHHVPHPNPVRD